MQWDISQPLQKNEIFALGTAWMGLEGIKLNEIREKKKDKYCMVSLTCDIKNK